MFHAYHLGNILHTLVKHYEIVYIIKYSFSTTKWFVTHKWWKRGSVKHCLPLYESAQWFVSTQNSFLCFFLMISWAPLQHGTMAWLQPEIANSTSAFCQQHTCRKYFITPKLTGMTLFIWYAVSWTMVLAHTWPGSKDFPVMSVGAH